MSTPSRLELIALTGIGEVRAGDDLAAVLSSAADAVAGGLRAGDVVVVSSKIVSKAEGRTVAGTDRLAAIEGETLRVVAERLTPRGPARIVHGRSGLVLAAAGVDASNVDPGTVLLLPVDSDASARALRAALLSSTGADVGVVVSDTLGRPWREGQVDLAIGSAGVPVTDDLRGATDTRGVPMEVTVRAVADELASAADLVKGKVAGVPAALIRGWSVPFSDDAPGAGSIARDPASDWFRLGHVEAVRSALGAPPGTVAPRPAPLDDVPSRLARAVAVALVTPGPEVSQSGVEVVLTSAGEDASALVALGAFAQRVVTAGWAESLTLVQTFSPPSSILLRAEASV